MQSSVIIMPLLNEAQRITKVLTEYANEFLLSDEKVSFIIVDDGSWDNSLAAVLELQRKYVEEITVIPLATLEATSPAGAKYDGVMMQGDPITVVSLAKATMKVGAVRLGMQLAGAAHVTSFVDTDDTIPATECRKLIAAIQTGVDLVVGSRFMAQSVYLNPTEDLNHMLELCKLTNMVSRVLFDCPWQDPESGAKALSQRAKELWLKQQTGTNLFFDAEMMELIKKAGLQIQEIPISFKFTDKYYLDRNHIMSAKEIAELFNSHCQTMITSLLETRITIDAETKIYPVV